MFSARGLFLSSSRFFLFLLHRVPFRRRRTADGGASMLSIFSCCLQRKPSTTFVSVTHKFFSELTEGINLNSRNQSTSGHILSQLPPIRRSQYFNFAQFQQLSVYFQLVDTRYFRCRPSEARGTNGADSASKGRVRPGFSLPILVLIYCQQ